MGQLYLTNVDFLKNGVPASIIATAVRINHLRLYSIRLNEYHFHVGCLNIGICAYACYRAMSSECRLFSCFLWTCLRLGCCFRNLTLRIYDGKHKVILGQDPYLHTGQCNYIDIRTNAYFSCSSFRVTARLSSVSRIAHALGRGTGTNVPKYHTYRYATDKVKRDKVSD